MEIVAVHAGLALVYNLGSSYLLKLADPPSRMFQKPLLP
jgi:hypothetical protein